MSKRVDFIQPQGQSDLNINPEDQVIVTNTCSTAYPYAPLPENFLDLDVSSSIASAPSASVELQAGEMQDCQGTLGCGKSGLWNLRYTQEKTRHEFMRFTHRFVEGAVINLGYCGGFLATSSTSPVRTFIIIMATLNFCVAAAEIVLQTWKRAGSSFTVQVAKIRQALHLMGGILITATTSWHWRSVDVQCVTDKYYERVHGIQASSLTNYSSCTRNLNPHFVIGLVFALNVLRLDPYHQFALVGVHCCLQILSYTPLLMQDPQSSVMATSEFVVRILMTLVFGAVSCLVAVGKHKSWQRGFEAAIEAHYQMRASKRRMDSVDALLVSMVPPSALSRLLQSEQVHDVTPEATVLFSDMVHFTKWSSQRSPRQVVDMLSTLVRLFDTLAVSLEVVKVKTIGDCYWAVTGIPTPLEHHAEVMIGFGLALQEAVTKEAKAHRHWDYPIDTPGQFRGRRLIRFRTGIHSGPVQGGVFGTQQISYEIFGATSEVANQVEANAAPDSVTVSRSTKELAEENSFLPFHFKPWRKVVAEQQSNASRSVGASSGLSPQLASLSSLGEDNTTGTVGDNQKDSGSDDQGHGHPLDATDHNIAWSNDLSPKSYQSPLSLKGDQSPLSLGVPGQGGDETEGDVGDGVHGQQLYFAVQNTSHNHLNQYPGSVDGSSNVSSSNQPGDESFQSSDHSVRSFGGVSGGDSISERSFGGGGPATAASRRSERRETALQRKKFIEAQLRNNSNEGAGKKSSNKYCNARDDGSHTSNASSLDFSEATKEDLTERYSTEKYSCLPVYTFSDPVQEIEYQSFAATQLIHLRAGGYVTTTLVFLTAFLLLLVDASNWAGGATTVSPTGTALMLTGIMLLLWSTALALRKRAAIQQFELLGFEEQVRGDKGKKMIPAAAEGLQKLSLLPLTLWEDYVGPVCAHLAAYLVLVGCLFMPDSIIANDTYYLAVLFGVGVTLPSNHLPSVPLIFGSTMALHLVMVNNYLKSHQIFSPLMRWLMGILLVGMLITLQEKRLRVQFVEAMVARHFQAQQEVAARAQQIVLASILPDFVIEPLTLWLASNFDPAKAVIQNHESVSVAFVRLSASIDLSSPMGSDAEAGHHRGAFSSASWLYQGHTAVDEILTQNKIVDKVKTVGDIVMIAGSFRGHDPNTAATAMLEVGLLLHLRFQQSGDGSSDESKSSAITIGLHCGPVMGVVLGFSRLSFDIFGDTVNTASRVMSCAGCEGQIIASTDYIQYLAPTTITTENPTCDFGPVRDVQVKGKDNLMVQEIRKRVDAGIQPNEEQPSGSKVVPFEDEESDLLAISQ